MLILDLISRVFNALESFRCNRDLDGWQLCQAMEEVTLLETQEDSHALDQADYPIKIRITSEMLMHVEALRSLVVTEVSHAVPI